ncbi:type II toxin-antitoxin system VapC family toxin [Rhodoplanes roseus]|uniref:VapC toxin family PIN domain ribonuclease n=1 Tax=Rhodoplanes roseus TaxID=29409 RepID=A0A327L452_9BRAD|nr:type II toxin-antitoxin system VapC family toxin [Rhodoplanes roseus]RAI45361.1 VapC toxin family PIN domain ribonuclease [Rhodoplanes roseus]
MRITADTNVLVRALTEDDAAQSAVAQRLLAEAELVAVPSPVLCELVWVLSKGYRIPAAEISDALRRLIDSPTVAVNRPAVDAGLALLDRGGDFADGVIAHEGRWLSGRTFVSFDKQAVTRLAEAGEPARLLA